MNEERQGYPKWAGLLLALLLPGSTHFLAGKKVVGVAWYLLFPVMSYACLLAAVTPRLPGVAPAVALGVISLILWVVMMVQSYMAVPRVRFGGRMAFLVFFLIFHIAMGMPADFMVQAFKTPTASMWPTFVGTEARHPDSDAVCDHVFVDKLIYKRSDPQRGDLIVFSTEGIEHPHVRSGAFYVRRVAGLPGETVSINPPHLIINGREVDAAHVGGMTYVLASAHALSEAQLVDVEDEAQLSNGEYFVLGDNSEHALDSRYHGPIRRDSIVGKITKIYWPPSRIGVPK